MDNRRTQILINRKFQLQVALVVVAMTVFLTNLFILYLSLFPGDQPLEMTSMEAWAIGLIELILVIGVWYASLKSTHKVAGPMFVIARQLKAVGAGDIYARISLRDGDMFQQEAAAINESLDQLQTRLKAVQSAATTLKQAQADGGDIAAPLEELSTALAALRISREV